MVFAARLLTTLQSARHGKKKVLFLFNLRRWLIKFTMDYPLLVTLHPRADWIPLDKTPTSVKDIREFMFNQLASAPMPEEFGQTWAKFAKGACQVAQKAELLETRLDNTTAAEKKLGKFGNGKPIRFLRSAAFYAKDAGHIV